MIARIPNDIRGALLPILLGMSAVGLFGACKGPVVQKDAIVVTIPPLKLILQEILGDERGVVCILPPGTSPHSFELRPSTARVMAEAKAIFYADESIDGWAIRTSSAEKVAVFPLVPAAMALDLADGHVHEGEGAHSFVANTGAAAKNAHFWSDPGLVREIVPALVDILAALYPADETRLRANGEAFRGELSKLDEAIRASRPELKDYGLVAFHPSWDYFFTRYGIEVTAYIEPFPGKEPTPRILQALQEAMRRHERRIVLSEVQLSPKSAQVLAESIDASVTVIDPLGGGEGMDTYATFLQANTSLLWEAFQ